MKVPPNAVAMMILMANQRFSWKTVLGEFFDNSLDANATTILVEIGKNKKLIVEDNGHGMGPDQISAMVTLGEHIDRPGGGLGRYGIGAKDAALMTCGEHSNMTVTSLCGQKRTTIGVNWMDCARNEWEIGDPLVDEVDCKITGTTITAWPVCRSVPHGASWDDLMSELGYIYHPAIASGKLITVGRGKKDGRRLVGWRMPKLMESPIVDTDITIPGGGTAHIRCGIVAEGAKNDRMGFTYVHRFRTIMQKGSGGHDMSRICGVVEIGDSWKLTKNKDDIANANKLYAAVEEACGEVFNVADEQASMLSSSAFTKEVESVLNGFGGVCGGSKGKNGKGDGRSRGVGNGNGDKSIQTGKYHFKYENSGNQAIGKCLERTIVLNLDNPAIKRTEETKNVLAAAMCCAWLISTDNADPRKKFRGQLRMLDTQDPRRYAEIVYAIMDKAAINGSRIDR